MNRFDLNDLLADHYRQDSNQDTTFEPNLPQRARLACFRVAFPNTWVGREVAVREHMRRFHSN